MKLICAGLNKTGTKSIARALRILGYKVFDYDDQILSYGNEWIELFSHGKVPDFFTMFKGVDVVIDYPCCLFFEELMEVFPDAKVILSVRRDEDKWVESFTNHLDVIKNSYLTKMDCFLPTFRKMMNIIRSCRMAAMGIIDSKSTYICRKRYRWHNDRVKSVVPAEKLLVFSVDQGWEPLCEFTGKKIPDQSFPHLNVKALNSNTGSWLTETALGRNVAREFNNVVMVCCAVMVIVIGVLLVYVVL